MGNGGVFLNLPKITVMKKNKFLEIVIWSVMTSLSLQYVVFPCLENPDFRINLVGICVFMILISTLFMRSNFQEEE